MEQDVMELELETREEELRWLTGSVSPWESVEEHALFGEGELS